jgi:hypothetical protein
MGTCGAGATTPIFYEAQGARPRGFLEDGRLSIDNNASESALRGIVVERRLGSSSAATTHQSP